jgi:hypothetical protein
MTSILHHRHIHSNTHPILSAFPILKYCSQRPIEIMKLLLPTAVLGFAQLSLADFYIFRVDATKSSGNTEFGYRIADVADPNCASLKQPWYGLKADVTGETLGVSCQGDGCTSGVVSYSSAADMVID